ncbi:DUF3644 domain-containing protein [Sediminispirochaeta bajacaliforniensis]|uniref:DUF3644 domain-containing protein n=1 Tax=Sediminispirochaeta bajacaliforniensis TaxID=148 RepID=UPI000379BB52|nr:DUF3644 domain-containing protein [Sediminispirochaeta bajacaliforniensis]
MPKEGYKKTYHFLKKKYEDKSLFTFTELAEAADYKVTSIHTYFRNSLKNKFISQKDKNKLIALDEIDSFSENEFIQYCSQKKVDDILELDLSDYLRENSIQCMLSAIELHNKPNISYRYQTVAILLINSWELILKSYITKYYPDINIFQSDGHSKPFEKILNCVIDQLGKEYFHIRENLIVLYEYRCKFIHFYEEDIDPLSPCVNIDYA